MHLHIVYTLQCKQRRSVNAESRLGSLHGRQPPFSPMKVPRWKTAAGMKGPANQHSLVPSVARSQSIPNRRGDIDVHQFCNHSPEIGEVRAVGRMKLYKMVALFTWRSDNTKCLTKAQKRLPEMGNILQGERASAAEVQAQVPGVRG